MPFDQKQFEDEAWSNPATFGVLATSAVVAVAAALAAWFMGWVG